MQRLRVHTYFLVALFLAMTCLTGAAQADTSIAVVDIDKLLSESSAAESIKSQVKTHSKKFESEMEAMETQLRDSFQKLKDDSKGLSKEDLQARGMEFEKKRNEAKTSLRKKLSELNKGSSAAMSKLSEAIFQVSANIAEEKGYDLIITRNNVIVGTKELDITDLVMERLNSTLKDVKVNVPQ